MAVMFLLYMLTAASCSKVVVAQQQQQQPVSPSSGRGASRFGAFHNFQPVFDNIFGSNLGLPQQQSGPVIPPSYVNNALYSPNLGYYSPNSNQQLLFPGQNQQQFGSLPLSSPFNWFSPYYPGYAAASVQVPRKPAGRMSTTPLASPLPRVLTYPGIFDLYALPAPPALSLLDRLRFLLPYLRRASSNTNAPLLVILFGLQQPNPTPWLSSAVNGLDTTRNQFGIASADEAAQTTTQQPISHDAVTPTAAAAEAPTNDDTRSSPPMEQQQVDSNNNNNTNMPLIVVKPIEPTIIDPFKPSPLHDRASSDSSTRPAAVDDAVKPAVAPPSTLNANRTTTLGSVVAAPEAESGAEDSSTTSIITHAINTNSNEQSSQLIEATEETTVRPSVVREKPKPSTSTTLPATTTQKPVTTTTRRRAPPSSGTTKKSDCKVNDADGVCYFLSNRKADNFIDAIEQCRQRDGGMVLARATENNTDFLDKLIDETLPKEALKNCTDRITMLGGWMPFMRYGSYAFAYGDIKQQCKFDEKQPFQSCAKDFDCTLVDWTRPAYFVCASSSRELPQNNNSLADAARSAIVARSVQDELCMWTAHATQHFEYLTSCQPLRPPSGDSKIIELPQFPARCVPIDFGDFYGETIDAILAARRKLGQEKVSFWSSTIDPSVGQLKQCAPNCDDNEADDNSYAICRREVVKAKLPTFFQTWHYDARVPYVLSDSFNETEKATILSYMHKLTNASCVRFEEVAADAAPPTFLHILKDESPATCRATLVGYVPGRVLLSLGEQCFGLPASILRLLLQTVGIPAEQNRFDRDEHISVNFDNILADPIYKIQYEKQPLPGLLQLGTPYDFFTVAHFPKWVYAKSKGVNVFVTKVKQVGGKNIDIDKNADLTDTDRAKLAILYGENCSS